MEWYVKVLKNYVGFAGRARRREYWFFTLVSVLVALALTVVDAELNTNVFAPLYWLAVLLPTIAVTVRRLHDTNHSGWWLLIGLVPLVGSIILLVFTLTDGTPGANRYGESPKKSVVAATPPAVA